MEQLRNVVRGDELWDDDGRLWSRGKPRWLDARAVDRWLCRDGVVAYHGPSGDAVTWLSHKEASAWWASTASALEVPGVRSAAAPDPDGRTYGARIWRSGDQRLLSFEAIC